MKVWRNFLKWALFQENLKVFSDATENLEKEMARIGEKKDFGTSVL